MIGIEANLINSLTYVIREAWVAMAGEKLLLQITSLQELNKNDIQP